MKEPKASTVAFSNIDYRSEIDEKDKLIEKLYQDMKELHSSIDQYQVERNEAIEKH